MEVEVTEYYFGRSEPWVENKTGMTVAMVYHYLGLGETQLHQAMTVLSLHRRSPCLVVLDLYCLDHLFHGDSDHVLAWGNVDFSLALHHLIYDHHCHGSSSHFHPQSSCHWLGIHGQQAQESGGKELQRAAISS